MNHETCSLLFWQMLGKFGWVPLKPLGGVSLLASPKAYEGKRITYKTSLGSTQMLELDNDNIVKVISDCTNLHLSRSSGIPGYIQFGFSLQEEEYCRAVEALREFQGMVNDKKNKHSSRVPND